MHPKRPYVATLDEVHITRDGENAVIEYLEPNVMTSHFGIGPQIHAMSD
jgi:hypothetical protein